MTAPQENARKPKYRDFIRRQFFRSARRANQYIEVMAEQHVEVVIIVPKRMRVTCSRCGHGRTVTVRNTGRAPSGWRKCPNGCNANAVKKG